MTPDGFISIEEAGPAESAVSSGSASAKLKLEVTLEDTKL